MLSIQWILAIGWSPRLMRPQAKMRMEEYASCFGNEIMKCVVSDGAVLMRGFSHSACPYEFSRFVTELDLVPFVDLGESAAPRTNVAPHLFTANEAPPEAEIPFHHEMAQSAESPRFIFFFCQTPASNGGATKIVHSHDVASFVMDMHPDASDMLIDRGIRYSRVLPSSDDMSSPIGKSWKRAFGPTRADAERILSERGFQWHWNSNDDLHTLTPRCEVFGTDAQNRTTFFNSVVGARKGWSDARNRPDTAVVYADDATSLDDECARLFDAAGAHMEDHAYPTVWERGDVLLLDNRQILHARASFAGSRRILTSLWNSARSL